MSNTYTIEELINGYYDQEFSRVSVEPVPKFSIKHRIKMKRAFNLYQKKAKPLSMVSSNEKIRMSLRKRVIIAVMVIVFYGNCYRMHSGIYYKQFSWNSLQR